MGFHGRYSTYKRFHRQTHPLYLSYQNFKFQTEEPEFTAVLRLASLLQNLAFDLDIYFIFWIITEYEH